MEEKIIEMNKSLDYHEVKQAIQVACNISDLDEKVIKFRNLDHILIPPTSILDEDSGDTFIVDITKITCNGMYYICCNYKIVEVF